jgi:hypothetical protein
VHAASVIHAASVKGDVRTNDRTNDRIAHMRLFPTVAILAPARKKLARWVGVRKLT